MKKSPQQSAAFLLFLRINRFGFAPLIVATFGIMGLTAVTYQGFVAKMTGVPADLIVLMAVLSAAVLLLDKMQLGTKLDETSGLVLRLNAIMLPSAFVVYYALNQLELTRYPNYVFSTFHLHLFLLQRLLAFSFFLVVVLVLHILDISFASLTSLSTASTFAKASKNTLLKQKVLSPDNRELLGISLFFIAIMVLISIQTYSVLKGTLSDVVAIARHPFASWEERKVQKFGPIYGTYQFINDHTEPDSIIAVPPQHLWHILGNVGFSRYFLYPRFLIHPEDFTDETTPEIDYYLIGDSHDIDGGKTYEIWPMHELQGSEIYLYNEALHTTEKIDQTLYDPTNPIFRNRWGLIKLIKQ